MADSPEFRAGMRQGDAERMVWLLRTVSNAQSLEEVQKRVDDMTRQLFPDFYDEAKRT